MKIMAGTNDSPEQMAERLGLTIQYALIDFDIHDPTLQVIGGDPVDLSEIPHEPVKSIIPERGIITIVAHDGEGQEVADFLPAVPWLSQVIVSYGEQYRDEGIMTFAMNAMTEEQIDRVERTVGRRIPGR
jgi:hypothetical protein